MAQLNALSWGIVIINMDAEVAGALPDPQDDFDRAGWVIRGRIFVKQDSLSDSSQWGRTERDVKGQRKFSNEEQTLQLVVNNAGAFSLNWAAFIRVLIKRRS